jgi:hypothetical protein
MHIKSARTPAWIVARLKHNEAPFFRCMLLHSLMALSMHLNGACITSFPPTVAEIAFASLDALGAPVTSVRFSCHVSGRVGGSHASPSCFTKAYLWSQKESSSLLGTLAMIPFFRRRSTAASLTVSDSPPLHIPPFCSQVCLRRMVSEVPSSHPFCICSSTSASFTWCLPVWLRQCATPATCWCRS